MPDYPYKLARLVNEDKPISDNPNERWYISFWIWDVQQGKLVRKRDYEVNQYGSVKERLKFAKQRIKEIDKLLASGYHVDSVQKQKQAAIPSYKTDMPVLKALKMALDIKEKENRKSTNGNTLSVYTMFEAFVKLQKWERIPVNKITQQDILLFLDNLRTTNSIANSTCNNYLARLRALFTILVSRKMIEVNPAAGIPELPTESGRNLAFNEAQIKELKDAILKRDPYLWDFVQFMFYGFIRPGEISQLTVGLVNLKEGHIFIPDYISKNKKSGYVKISSHFRECLIRLGCDKRPAHEYIFQRRSKPGKNIMLPENYMSALHLEILRDLKYSEDYTLYSWKHTGVCMHYRAGIDIKSLQEQIRHWSILETDNYLKSLGLFENKAIEDKSPAL